MQLLSLKISVTMVRIFLSIIIHIPSPDYGLIKTTQSKSFRIFRLVSGFKKNSPIIAYNRIEIDQINIQAAPIDFSFKKLKV